MPQPMPANKGLESLKVSKAPAPGGIQSKMPQRTPTNSNGMEKIKIPTSSKFHGESPVLRSENAAKNDSPGKKEAESPFSGTGLRKAGFRNFLRDKTWQAAKESRLPGASDRFARSKVFDKYITSRMGANISKSDLDEMGRKINLDIRNASPGSKEHTELLRTRDYLQRIQKMK